MKKNKKIVKLAVLREDPVSPCPFGLPISYACKTVGEVIYKMTPLESLDPEEAEVAQGNNNYLFRWDNPQRRCPYAAKIIEGKDIVECNFGTDSQGTIQEKTFIGSPVFYNLLNFPSFDGLYSYPIPYYGEAPVDRGMYYGQYGLEAPANSKFKIKKKGDNEE